ncbi:aminoacyl--tRNA ligase-related protein [Paenibacillus kobensis]|uniref:aminoacyl--tRNA ligase-related protein n=1 Tax=Paenibacillus kobensis TaxID=59841 RepID=UPI000FDA8480|nr:aminoacyl--tRNA ligase-related protein [Paenibacillus kobensis]
MNQIFISLNQIHEADTDDIIRLIGFASEQVISIDKTETGLVVVLEDRADVEEVQSKIHRMIKHKQAPNQQSVIYTNGNAKNHVYGTEFPDDLVRNYGDGLIGLKGEAIWLLEYFDAKFKTIAQSLAAIETQYPTLLPITAFDKTGYLRTSPQYSMFVCHPREDVDNLLKVSREVQRGEVKELVAEPHLVLSPAACFHCYMDLEHAELAEPSVYTFRQKVFRHEGRMNWGGFGRLRDYHVREIVLLGDHEFIVSQRQHVLEEVKRVAEEIGLIMRVSVTSDPFVIPSMQKFKKIQLEEESKIELQLAYGPDNYLAVSSFNIHGTAFTEPFEITVKNVRHTVTGCIGFGLERWVLAFMAQHGTDPVQWKKILNV